MKKFEPRNNRRAIWHDYKSRAIYMITITRTRGVPDFSYIVLKNERFQTELTYIGDIIVIKLGEMCKKYYELSTYDYIIMPDHIHFILNVSADIDYHIGKAIGDFKRACTKRYKEFQKIDAKDFSLFEDGYHDRILSGRDQLKTMKRYVRDNPRRLHIKRTRPDLFTTGLTIKINGEEFDAFGNIFLLRNPEIEAVKVSSKFSEEELRLLDRRWIRTIEEGGVLVSPFISPKEKIYRDLAIENGANVIILLENGFGERFKPSGQYFDLCAEGRLLLIAPKEHTNRRETITRGQALRMNDLAVAVASGNFTASLSSR